MPIHRVLRLGRGAIIALDSSEPDEIRILANNLPVAKGSVIVSGNRIAVGGEGTFAARTRRMLKPATSRHDGSGRRRVARRPRQIRLGDRGAGTAPLARAGEGSACFAANSVG